jgi:hypothetical protein
MTTAGLLIMSLSVGVVSALFFWCVYKVLITPTDNVRGIDLDTPDMHEGGED